MEFELGDIGAANDGFESEVASVWSGTESTKPQLSLGKRAHTGKVILRKGPAPLQDLALTGQSNVALYPGMLDDRNLEDPTSVKLTGEDDFASDLQVSRAGSIGLLTYFAKLANSPEDETIDVEFVESLLRGGADINVTDCHGQSIMHEVAREWHVDVAQFCMEKGADIDKPDSFGRTPLHLAASINYTEMIQWLIDHGADVQRKTFGELQTPIHYAAKGNAIQGMQTLLKNDADILDRDFKERTPLSVAAEQGMNEACAFLLEYGAPAGVYDDCGTSALSVMIEKMPNIAEDALSQFQEVNTALRKKYFYLNYLEVSYWRALGQREGKPLRQSYARSPLKMIVLYNELNLIMHPVILQLVKLKWSMFGQKFAIINVLINVFYTIVWTAIAIVAEKRHVTTHYTPMEDHVFKIIVEALGVIMTLVFIIQQVIAYRRNQARFTVYKQWKLREIERDKQYCHPQWPEEERFINAEMNLVKTSHGSFLADPWLIFEFITYLGVLLIMSTRVSAILMDVSSVYTLHQRISAIVLIIIWLRLMKFWRAFQTLGPFITMIGHIITATLKFAFLFFELFIPYCCAFWIIFGEKEGTEFNKLNDLMYQVFLMTLTADYKFGQIESQDKLMAQILVGTYLALASLVCLNLYIALMSDTFARIWNRATANAFMSQASELLITEENLSEFKHVEMSEVLLKSCSPQVISEGGPDGNGFSDNAAVDKMAHKLDLLNKSVQKLTENSVMVTSELRFLKDESLELQMYQEKTMNEILRLTKDSSKWEIRNILKTGTASFTDTLKRRFTKEQGDETASSVHGETNEDVPEKSRIPGFKWLKK